MDALNPPTKAPRLLQAAGRAIRAEARALFSWEGLVGLMAKPYFGRFVTLGLGVGLLWLFVWLFGPKLGFPALVVTGAVVGTALCVYGLASYKPSDTPPLDPKLWRDAAPSSVPPPPLTKTQKAQGWALGIGLVTVLALVVYGGEGRARFGYSSTRSFETAVGVFRAMAYLAIGLSLALTFLARKRFWAHAKTQYPARPLAAGGLMTMFFLGIAMFLWMALAVGLPKALNQAFGVEYIRPGVVIEKGHHGPTWNGYWIDIRSSCLPRATHAYLDRSSWNTVANGDKVEVRCIESRFGHRWVREPNAGLGQRATVQ